MGKTSIVLLLLLAWISGSSYWYVCKIREDCQKESLSASTPVPAETSVQAQEAALQASVGEAKAYLTAAGKQVVYFEPYAVSAAVNSIPEEYPKKLKFYLDNNPEAKVMVSGHTDTSGPRAENIRLSQSRTDFMKTYLVNAGIRDGQIVATSKVDSEPAASNSTPEERAKNRRAEIKF